MATYITTMQYTQQGLQGIQDSPKRAAAFKAAAKKLGVKVTALYWTLGAFDGVIISEAADDAAITAAMLQLGMLGNIRTTTTRAFDLSEFESVVNSIGKK